MAELPRSLPEFEARFPDEAACARWLLGKRWPDGFRCPACGHDKGLGAGPRAADAPVRGLRAPGLGHRRHRAARQPPRPAHLVPGRLAGGDAQERHLRPCSCGCSSGWARYKSAWLLVRKLRRAICSTPSGSRSPAWWRSTRPACLFAPRASRSAPGARTTASSLVAGAVEIEGKGPGRIRLAVIDDCSAVALGAFVAAAVAARSTVVSYCCACYKRLKHVKHDPSVVGDAPAHLVLPCVHRVFANAKRCALRVYHGLREKHLQAYLDEFVFLFNRLRAPHAAFYLLLGLSLTLEPATYQMLVGCARAQGWRRCGRRGRGTPRRGRRSSARTPRRRPRALPGSRSRAGRSSGG